MTGSTGRWAPSVAIGLPLALGALLTACGIPTGDSSFREIPSEEILFDLDETSTSTSTTTTTTTIPLVPVTTIETTTTEAPREEVDIFFLSRGRLRGVPRPLARGFAADELVDLLERGPAGEAEVGLTSLIEPGLITSTQRAGGIITIDLDPDIFGGIPASDQREAIGQIVLTMANLRGVGPVLFTLGGEPIRVTKGNGLLSGEGEPVSADDYEVRLATASSTDGTTTTTTTTTTELPPPETTVAPADPTASVPTPP